MEDRISAPVQSLPETVFPRSSVGSRGAALVGRLPHDHRVVVSG